MAKRPVSDRKLRRALKQQMRRDPEAVRAGLRTVGFHLGRQVIANPIPRRDGVLARSLYVTKSPPTGNAVVQVGVNTVYARRQHYEHATRSLYLQGPFDGLRGRFLRLLAKASQDAARGAAARGPFPARPPRKGGA